MDRFDGRFDEPFERIFMHFQDINCINEEVLLFHPSRFRASGSAPCSKRLIAAAIFSEDVANTQHQTLLTSNKFSARYLVIKQLYCFYEGPAK